MFVRSDWRGAGKGVAQELLNVLEKWAIQHNLKELYLGTIERLQAAIQFYVKNGFEPVNPDDLPGNFPRMDVDTHFFGKRLL
jgi:GNAT superfamily N-acetyltransferase